MKTVVNTTLRPLAVPLPGNKVLRLGPRGHGQIRDEAAPFGPLQRLVEAGTLKLQAGDDRTGVVGSGGVTPAPGGGHPGRGAIRSSRGDR